MSFSHSPLARLNTTLSRVVVAGLMAVAGASALAQTTSNPVIDGNSQAASMAAAKHRAEQAKAEAEPSMGQTSQPTMTQNMGRHDPSKMQARMAQHMSEFKSKLMITPAQEGAWNSFTAAMQPPAQMAARMTPAQRQAQRAEMDQLKLPERLDKTRAMRTEHMNAMNASMAQREQAAKALYAALSPEQQKVMDAEHRKMSRHGMHQGAHKPMNKENRHELNKG